MVFCSNFHSSYWASQTYPSCANIGLFSFFFFLKVDWQQHTRVIYLQLELPKFGIPQGTGVVQVRYGKRQDTTLDKRGVRNTRLKRPIDAIWTIVNHGECPVVKLRKDFKTFRRTTPSSVGQVGKELAPAPTLHWPSSLFK